MKKLITYGIIVLIAISTLFRGLFFSFETYAFLAVISLLCFLYYFCKIRNNEAIHFNKLFLGLGIALIAANILSFINAVNPRENLGSVLLYTILIIVFHVLFDYFYDKKQQFIKGIMISTVLTGFICAVIGLEALTGSFDFLSITLFNNRLGSTFQYTNTASIYFVLCILFSLTIASTSKSLVFRALVTGAGNIFIFALFMTGSRGGYLVGMAAILLFLFIQPNGNKVNGMVNLASMLIPLILTLKECNSSIVVHDYLSTTKWLMVSFILASGLFLLFYLVRNLFNRSIPKNKSIILTKSSRIIFIALFSIMIISLIIFWDRFLSILPAVLSNRLQHMNLNDPNILFRLEFDKDAVKLIAGNWLLGLGGGGWIATYQSIQDVFYTANFVHNHYLQIFVENGILGFISYIAFIFITFSYTIVTFIKAKDNMLKVYCAGLLCSFLALSIHSSFDFDLSFISLVLLLWTLSAAALVKPTEEKYESAENINKLLLIGKISLSANNMYKIISVSLCAILFSTYTLFFTGAFNEYEAKKYMKARKFHMSMSYYEEANRLDPQNTIYLFELSKLYNYFAEISKNNEDHNIWLKKAISAGKESINGNRYYPPQLKTLIQSYSDLQMPWKALEYSQKLVLFQRCNSANYEILAQAYLDTAKFYKEKNDIKKTRELLAECIALKSNSNLINSNTNINYNMMEKKNESNFKPSQKLDDYFNEASDILNELNKR